MTGSPKNIADYSVITDKLNFKHTKTFDYSMHHGAFAAFGQTSPNIGHFATHICIASPLQFHLEFVWATFGTLGAAQAITVLRQCIF